MEPDPITIEKKKVRGGLLFICILFTIVSPLLTFYTLYINYKLFVIGNILPMPLNVFIAESIVRGGIVFFSVYAGIKLWKVEKNAIVIGKRYLKVLLGFIIINNILSIIGSSGLFLEGASPEEIQRFVSKQVGGLLRGILYVGLCYTYLTKSERVKQLFGENLEVKEQDISS